MDGFHHPFPVDQTSLHPIVPDAVLALRHTQTVNEHSSSQWLTESDSLLQPCRNY